MDYPQLNLIFGLGLFLTVVVSISLRILLSRASLPIWMSSISWVALIINLLSALYIEILFLRLMTPVFNRQIVLGLLLFAGVAALVTAGLYRKEMSSRASNIVFIVQILASLVGVALALVLYLAWCLQARYSMGRLLAGTFTC